MSDHAHWALADLASAQHGVFSLAQARAVGVTSDVLRQRTKTGEFERTEEGVYLIRGSVPTWHRSASSAVLSVEGGVGSHATAARLWGLIEKEPRGHEVTTRRWRRKKRQFVVHESLDLSPGDRRQVAGIATTSPARTVVDLGASARWAVEEALESGVRRQLFTLDDVRRFVDRVARRGRRGVGVIRPLLERRLEWDLATESELESKFLRLVEESDLKPPVSQYVVRSPIDEFVCRADFAYPSSRLLVELDSEAYHMDRLTFRRDREKQNKTELLGWRTLRYTWWDLVDHPNSVRRDLAAAISG